MQLESECNGKVKIRNKELLNEKKKLKKGKRALRFKEKKLLFHQQTGAQWFTKWQTFFDIIIFSIIGPSAALNHLSKLKTAQ